MPPKLRAEIAALVLRALGKPLPGENLKADEATVVLYDRSSLTERTLY